MILPSFKFKVRKEKPPVKKEWRRYAPNFFYGGVELNSHGDFVCVVRVDGELKQLEFTPKSYELKDRQRVFVRDNLRLSYIRTPESCHISPGNQDKLIPFAPKWIVKGRIMLDRDDNMWFDFDSLITIKGFNYPREIL